MTLDSVHGVWSGLTNFLGPLGVQGGSVGDGGGHRICRIGCPRTIRFCIPSGTGVVGSGKSTVHQFRGLIAFGDRLSFHGALAAVGIKSDIVDPLGVVGLTRYIAVLPSIILTDFCLKVSILIPASKDIFITLHIHQRVTFAVTNGYATVSNSKGILTGVIGLLILRGNINKLISSGSIRFDLMDCSTCI